jgi:hypothetical protein
MREQREFVEGLIRNPRVKSIAFHPDGTLERVELYEGPVVLEANAPRDNNGRMPRRGTVWA